ncbi:MAG: glycogen synthase GlgA [Marinisporobacter sp.]|jgi:starch synthase|nr:glycogen synthase GlgA [Marinisporobacter sp.]
MKVLIAASEAYPFAKTGGLGDVIGALPKALKKNGVDARVVMPYYDSIPDIYRNNTKHIGNFHMNLGWRSQYCGVEQLELDGVTYYFIDNEYYFKRGGCYGYFDEAERFAYFSKAVIDALHCMNFMPDIIHCNDWQTALIPAYLKLHYGYYADLGKIKTLLTIHNLKYQGRFDGAIIEDVLGIDEEHFTPDKFEYHKDINLLKAGIVFSDYITTVSPTYAEEIKRPEFGEGLDGLLSNYSHKLCGILNGVDDHIFDPENDALIFKKYNMNNIEDKYHNKNELQKCVGLHERWNVPIISIISRLVSQKGLDLVESVLHEILKEDVQLIVLGKGDSHYENMFLNASKQYEGKVATIIGFDEGLAHKIYAGSDMFLMPSRFEPCGIGQLIALKYGTLPIVRETGGLYDTVRPYNEYTGDGNGFSFMNYNAHDMLHTIKRAVGFHYDRERWENIMKNSMSCEYGWDLSAKKYIQVYENLMI